jgi:WD40 repeat protein/tetratricopeptide (TPR) repeat protein
MNDPHQREDVAKENENSLKALVRAIRLSQGQFRLILARCNYGALRERMVQRLRELSPVEIREIVLPKSFKSLYSAIHAQLGDEMPQALMVLGLESVNDIQVVLTSSNTIREEFKENFPFPLVLWMNDEVFKTLRRIAPDFESWATSVEFSLTTEELINFLRQKVDQLFTDDATITFKDCSELEAACRELQRRGQELEPDLEASLEFVRGLDDFVNDRIDAALAHYQNSLVFWQDNSRRGAPTCALNSRLERQGILLLNIALCYNRKAELNRAQSQRFWKESRNSFQQCLNRFEQAERPDLVAKHINKLGEVLRNLQDWHELKTLAKRALILHQERRDTALPCPQTIENNHKLRQVAQDYGFLAEVALEEPDAKKANQLAQQALQTLEQISDIQPHERGLYRYLIARSEVKLGQFQEAIVSLEQVRKDNNHQYNPQLYIDILKKLRSLYFQQGEYLKAFEVKQEQKSIEAQYGFRPFTGAGSLRPIKRIINPAFDPIDPQERAQERITASGRRSDLNSLIERLSRNDYKLIVIHGMSGVGKSSLLWAGLVPELQQSPIGDRIALPITLRYYTNWVTDLGSRLEKALNEIDFREENEAIRTQIESQTTLLKQFKTILEILKYSIKGILEQLRKSAAHNLLTVLIFDQFEEFFFVCTDLRERRQFYDFLRDCLNIPYVKVILSLREDYLHYLLECDRLANLDVINNNILDKNIRCYLGDFSPQRAKSVIRELTERSQFYLEPALVDELVQDLTGEDCGEVRPIELQVVGAQLQTENITTLEQYHQLGANPKETLVQRSLEDVIKDCGGENERAARLVLYLLTNENGTRPLKTRAELESDLQILGFESEVDQLDLVLEILVGSGLVFLVPDSPANRYQLVHDYLVAFIRQQQAPGLLAELAEAKEKQKLTEAQLREALKEKEEALRKEQEERKRAEITEIEALNSLSQALLLSHDQLGALLAAIKAGNKLQEQEIQARSTLKIRTVSRLLQVVYSVREHNRLQGHSDRVNSINFSSNGQMIASASADCTVKLWHTNGNLVKTFLEHSDEVNSVSFSPDGQMIASGSKKGTVKLWHIDGTQTQTFQNRGYPVNSVSFSPDGQLIASAGQDGTVKLWHTDGTLMRLWQGHTRAVSCVSFSPDNQMIASASYDCTVKLWNLDGNIVQTLQEHTRGVSCVKFSPDGQMIVSASEDSTVKLWQTDGTLMQTLKKHSDKVNSVSFSPDSQTLTSASDDGTVKLWRTDGRLMQTFKGHNDGIRSVSFSPDGQMIASASSDSGGTVRLWYTDNLAGQTFQRHSAGINSVSFSPDGQTLASASRDGTVKLWRIDGTVLQICQGHSDIVSSVSFSPSGQMIASASADSTIKIWHPDGTLIQTFQGHHNDWVASVSFSPNGQILASSSIYERVVKLWRIDGTLIQTLQGHSGWITSTSFSPDGRLIASASTEAQVKLWSLDGTLLQTFRGHTMDVSSVSFSPDGQMIASASADGTVKLWNLDGKPVQTFPGHSRGANKVSSVSFSPDGQMIASASYDRTVKLWSLDGTLLQTLQGHSDWVTSLSFSPDGQMLASGSKDCTVKLWYVGLEVLLERGCNWLRDYLKTNPNVSESDRHLCDDILTQK